ncbi:MAG TPA: DsrE family protein [Rhodoblastus sp.]|nr:DsrE family protein [Rhodoblastus sp.]
MKFRGLSLAIGLFFGAAATAAAFNIHTIMPHQPGRTADWVKRMSVEDYGRQRVIYHIDQRAGLFSGHFRHILQIAQNHVDAVGADKLDLRIILQGDGVDFLSWARDNPQAQAKIDNLKREGVKFQVCRNTLLARGIDPDRELYGVKQTDIVRAAVGEIASLEQQGFQYIKP